jgi:multiple sugar transport system ATP-binding protein
VLTLLLAMSNEPLSSLDAKLRVDMRTELKALHRRLKATFVYVTHDQAEAMTMADRIVVMSKGRIEQVGTPLDLYNRPASQFVAGFFGTPTMNFIEGTIEAAGDGRLFRSNGLEHSLTDTVPAVVAGRRAVLGVRSEHVVLGDGAPLKGTVQLTEPLGDTTLVHFDSTAGNRLVAKVGPSTACSPAALSRSASTPAIATCSTPRTGRGFIETAAATGHADRCAPPLRRRRLPEGAVI